MIPVPHVPLLEVADLSVTYRTGSTWYGRPRHHTAVRGVSFSIEENHTMGLVGESGSGKSTIGRAILRMLTPSGGAIRYRGEDFTSWGPRTPLRYRQAVQVVFQDPSTSLNPRCTVEETVAESVRWHRHLTGQPLQDEVSRLLSDVGLARHHAGRYPHELSGGQQQRVAIARALAPRPELVVCDEAVSALDVSTQSQVINLLQDLQAEYGVSYLFISHDLSVVRHICDTIAVLHQGELVEMGEADRVYDHPEADYTTSLLSAIPRMSAADRRRS